MLWLPASIKEASSSLQGTVLYSFPMRKCRQILSLWNRIKEIIFKQEISSNFSFCFEVYFCQDKEGFYCEDKIVWSHVCE